MNYSIISVRSVQRFFAVLAILAMTFGPFANVPSAQAARWDGWQNFNPDEEVITEYCSELDGAIDSLSQKIADYEEGIATANGLQALALYAKLEVANGVMDFLSELHNEFCTNIEEEEEEEVPETVDICHIPQGNTEKVLLHEDMPYSAWMNNGGQGHNKHDGDFLIETEEDLARCEDLIDEEEEGEEETDETVQVHIYKYLKDGEVIAQIPDDADIAPFPMVSSWNHTEGEFVGNGSYTLGEYKGGATLKYAADTAEMGAPADYTTSEVTGTSVVAIGAECVADKYRLVGYKFGNTLEDAQDATINNTAPEFVDLTSDRHVIVVNEDCNDVIDTTPTPVEPLVCVYSDETTQEGGEDSFVVPKHPAWATINGAEWIWGDAAVIDGSVDTIQTFTKVFDMTGTPSAASLEIASDNGYKLVINGTTITDRLDEETTYSSITTHDILAELNADDENTIEITVKNPAWETENPAGLAYKLTTTGVQCTAVTPTIEPSLVITNPATDGLVLSGTHTFEAEYIDDDEIVDAFQWAIRAGTCKMSTGAVAGNVDGFNDPYTFNSTIFSTTVDMTSWPDGGYCLVVNPKEQSGETPDLRATRLFTLENDNDENPGGGDGDEEDTYEVFGYVWDDSDEDDELDEEPRLGGWTVKATEQGGEEREFMDETDEDGRYSLFVPEGTWVISLLTQEGWVLLSEADGDGTYTVTVPVLVTDASFLQSVFSFIIPTAHAAVLGQVGPLNFGNNFVGNNAGGNRDTSGGNGRNISLRSGGNNDNTPSGQVEGASTSTLPAGQVLGESTSVMPVGAPNTGAGGAAPVAPSAQLHTLLAILSASPMRKKHG